MTNSQPHTDEPTNKQIKFLRNLATATGQSFAWPKTSREASEEIDRLKKVTRTGSTDRRRETCQVRHDMATGRGDAAAVRIEEETGGYGSSAHWS